MKVHISKYEIVLVWIMVYYTSKILWDRYIPGVLEIMSVGLVAYGAFAYFYQKKFKGIVGQIFSIYLVLCVYILFNGFFQNTTEQFIRSIYEYCFYILMFFAFAFYVERVDLLKCLKFVNVWGMIIAILSWYEYLSKTYIFPNNFVVTIYNTYGFRSTVFTRSYLSHAMILSFFSLVAMYLYYKTSSKQYMVSCIFSAVSVLTTSSRGPLVALIISLILFYVLNSLRKGVKNGKRLLIIISLVFLVLMAFLFLNSTFTTGIETIDYFLFRIRQIINWTGDAGNVGRLLIWKWALDLFAENLLFGIGPSHTGSWGTGSIGVTESGWLKYLCELGIVGFTIFVALIVNILHYGKKRYLALDENGKIAIAFFFSLVTLVIVNNITLQSSEEIQVNFIWALGMGGLLSGTVDKQKW